ncbi:betaine aldehyde dehydrogenase [Rhodococcus opacus PD630]|nr:betaine aldehyde dehydrogenase [Rhodococcus opacus PD630]
MTTSETTGGVDPMNIKKEIYIDGEWSAPEADAEPIVVQNPATEESIAQVPTCGAEDVDRAVNAASAAFEGWSTTSVAQRRKYFSRLHEIAKRREEEILHSIVSEIGHPIERARINQTGAGIADLGMLAEYLDDIIWEEKLGETRIRRVPAGVVAAITPWNAPLRAIAIKAGAAMAAGCTVVLKGSEIAPMVSFIFAEMVEEAGFPRGVFNLVSGSGSEVGEPMATHDLVEMVSLTGSVGAGRRVMELASRSVKRVALELGGKSANIILPDADLAHAVDVGIEDAFRSSGQVCGALSRMLVPASRIDEVKELVAQKVNSFVVGDPFDSASQLGPVASESQRARVEGYIQKGIDEGMTLLAGGTGRPDGFERGAYVRPTAFLGTNEHTPAQEEIFGPVLTVIPFDDDANAVRIANDSQYGLAGAVWSGDQGRAIAVAERIRTGRVRINGAPVDKRAPHGGFKLSGIGREQGRIGIEEFLEYQTLSI